MILLVSELVTNAVVHAECPAVLRVLLPRRPAGVSGRGTVRVEVADGSRHGPLRRQANGEDVHGRGLELVDGLADRWGWSAEGQGKRIWCELDHVRPLLCEDAGVRNDFTTGCALPNQAISA